MKTLLRTTLLVGALVLGAHTGLHAQTADSVLAVSSGGQSLLRLNADGGLVVRGTPGEGSIPAASGDVRMMWYPAKWAFRVGRTASPWSFVWEDSRIGEGSVALGTNNRAEGKSSFAAGEFLIAEGDNSVALGAGSEALGRLSFAALNGLAAGEASVAIGQRATAYETGAFALGQDARALGQDAFAIGAVAWATGRSATAIGLAAVASGERSVAIGTFADTNDQKGAMVLADNCFTIPADDYKPIATVQNQFVARFCGGYKLYTSQKVSEGEAVGVELAPGGGGWQVISDINRKENFEALDGEDVLVRLRDVPVMTWNYKTQDSEIRHAGPTAQDFRAAFGLGESDLTINTIDIDGINLAAIRALEERTARQRETIEALEARLARLEALLAGEDRP